MSGSLAHPPVIAVARPCCACKRGTVLVMPNIGGGFDPWCRACGTAVHAGTQAAPILRQLEPVRAPTPVRRTGRHRSPRALLRAH